MSWEDRLLGGNMSLLVAADDLTGGYTSTNVSRNASDSDINRIKFEEKLFFITIPPFFVKKEN
jgi:hypothetical protein